MGIDNFKAEVEKRLGWKLQPARAFEFTSNVDQFGWQTGEDGRRHFTAFIENGRVQDEPGKPFKTAMREIAKVHKGTFRLTANQHVIIADIAPEEEQTIRALLSKYHLDQVDFSALRLSSAACVALPTCGLAMAESERVGPPLLALPTRASTNRSCSFRFDHSTFPFLSRRLRRSWKRLVCETTRSPCV